MTECDTIIRNTPSGALTFIRNGEGLVLTGYEGKDMQLDLTLFLQDMEPVVEIAPKAFFNARELRSIELPGSVKKIGDWAFSHCPKLKKISLQEQDCELGKSLFEEDRKLRAILLLPKEQGEQTTEDIKGYGRLLAAAATILDAPYLLSAKREDDTQWLLRWDQRLESILNRDDKEGYTEVVLCGEEDYGSNENTLEEFMQKQRWRKVRLCFLRLLYDKKLAEADKKRLEEYLLSHTKGCSSEETWLFMVHERGEDPEYWELFTRLGCVTEENFDDCIASLPETLPQMRAYLLRWQSEHLKQTEVLDKLSLDW